MTAKITTHNKPNGRPCLLTPKLQTDICTLIAAGNYLTTACQSVGITTPTLVNWMERGQAEIDAGDTGGQFFVFFSAVKKAEADREAIMAQRVIDAALPGIRKTVTKVAMAQGQPVMGDDGKVVTYEEVTHTGGDWLAAMTFLERRYPERWARPDRGAPGGGNTYNINIEKAIIDAAGKFEAVIKRLAERAKAPHQLPATDTDTPDTGEHPAQPEDNGDTPAGADDVTSK